MNQQVPPQLPPSLEEQFAIQGFESVANGDTHPPLRMGYQPEYELQPGEQVIATIKHVFHGMSSFKMGPEKPFLGLVLDIQQAKMNQTLPQTIKTLYLRGTYRNDFLGGKWGINDLISVGYGGQKEPGVKTSKHLLYIQGKRSENSRFVPVPDHVVNEEDTPVAPPQQQAPTNFSGFMTPGTAPVQNNNRPVGPAAAGAAQSGFAAPLTNPNQQMNAQQQPNNEKLNLNPGVPTFN